VQGNLLLAGDMGAGCIGLVGSGLGECLQTHEGLSAGGPIPSEIWDEPRRLGTHGIELAIGEPSCQNPNDRPRNDVRRVMLIIHRAR